MAFVAVLRTAKGYFLGFKVKVLASALLCWSTWSLGRMSCCSSSLLHSGQAVLLFSTIDNASGLTNELLQLSFYVYGGVFLIFLTVEAEVA